MQEPSQNRSRLQFSMRLVLIVMAVFGIALGFAVYRKPTNGRTTSEKARRIKLEMTEYQVVSVLGAPLHRFESVLSLRWVMDDPQIYLFADGDIRFLDIIFDENGKVVEIVQAGRSLKRMPKLTPSGSTLSPAVR